jgi:pilus assembly protein Flp/PilA
MCAGVDFMTDFVASAKKFIRSEDAPTMVEYSLLLLLIALVVIVAAAALGVNIKVPFTTVAGSI